MKLNIHVHIDFSSCLLLGFSLQKSGESLKNFQIELGWAIKTENDHRRKPAIKNWLQTLTHRHLCDVSRMKVDFSRRRIINLNGDMNLASFGLWYFTLGYRLRRRCQVRHYYKFWWESVFIHNHLVSSWIRVGCARLSLGWSWVHDKSKLRFTFMKVSNADKQVWWLISFSHESFTVFCRHRYVNGRKNFSHKLSFYASHERWELDVSKSSPSMILLLRGNKFDSVIFVSKFERQ